MRICQVIFKIFFHPFTSFVFLPAFPHSIHFFISFLRILIFFISSAFLSFPFRLYITFRSLSLAFPTSSTLYHDWRFQVSL
jgi:hypothetical protein